MSGQSSTTYLLDVEVELDKAMGQVVAFRDRSKSEFAVAGAGIKQELDKVERKAADTFTKSADGASTFGESVGKLKPIMGTATRAIAAFGIEGAGQFSGLTRAATSLAINGFTPVGFAITAATVAFGVFMDHVKRGEEEAAAVAAKLAAQHEKEAAALEKIAALQERINDARAQRLGKESGQSGELAKADLAVQDAEAKLRRMESAPFSVAQAERIRLQKDELAVLRDKLAVEQRIAEARDGIKLDGSIRDPLAGTPGDYGGRTTRNPNYYAPGRDPFRGARSGPVEDGSRLNAMVQQEQQAAATVQALRDAAAAQAEGVGTREIELQRLLNAEKEKGTGASEEELAIRARLVADYEEELRLLKAAREEKAAAAADAKKDPRAGFNFLGASADFTDAQRAADAKQRARAAAEQEQISRSFGTSAAHTLTQALNDGIKKGDLSTFTSTLQGAMTDAILGAFLQAAVEKPLASLLGDLTGKVGGFANWSASSQTGAGAGTDTSGLEVEASASGVAAKRLQRQPDIQLANIIVADEAAADAVAARVSGSGARAIVSRAGGGGFSKGSKPARRSR